MTWRRAAASAVLLACAVAAPAASANQPDAEPGASPAASAAPVASPASTAPTAPAPLRLAKTHLELNPKASTAIAISGGVPPYSVAYDASIAEANVDAGRATLDIRALGAGSTTVRVADARGSSVTATLLVGPNAGFVPAALGVSLVGSPGADYIAAQVLAALARATHPLPGARVATSGVAYPSNMRPGERLDVAVRVHLDGVGRYVDVDGIANVHVVTRAAQQIEPLTLFYSDDPEKISDAGVLYGGRVSVGHPIRLYYYHQAAVADRRVGILLDAPGGTATVRVVGHGAGPNAAVMFVGESATFRYLDDRARGAGVTLEVPVGAPLELLPADGPLAAGDLVAGVLDVAVDTGDPVRVQVVVLRDNFDPRGLLGMDELSSDGKGRRGEYDVSKSSEIAFAYRAGEPEPAPFVAGGLATALPSERPGGHVLAGDYGVLRPLDFTLANPTNAEADVFLYERPVGFPVTTTIYFAGEAGPLRVRCVKDAEKRYLVRAFAVPPGATEHIGGTYMTDGGSTYPLTLGLSAVPPEAPPATLTGPEGCFAKPALLTGPSPDPVPRSAH